MTPTSSIYACDKSDVPRQQVALDLVAGTADGVLLWQMACEFVAASRKLSGPFQFLANMTRQKDLGMEAEALEICKGVLLGLYCIRDLKGDGVLGWAPDLSAEAAAEAVRIWGARAPTRGAGRSKRLCLPQEFVDEYIAEWGGLLARALERP